MVQRKGTNNCPLQQKQQSNFEEEEEDEEELSSTFKHNQDLNLKKLHSGLQGTHGGRQVVTLEVKPRIQEVSRLRFPWIFCDV